MPWTVIKLTAALLWPTSVYLIELANGQWYDLSGAHFGMSDTVLNAATRM